MKLDSVSRIIASAAKATGRLLDSIKFRVVVWAAILFACASLGTSLVLMRRWANDIDARQPAPAAQAVDRMCALVDAGLDPTTATVSSAVPVEFQVEGPEGTVGGTLATGVSAVSGPPLAACRAPVRWDIVRTAQGARVTASRSTVTDAGPYTVSATVTIPVTTDDVAKVTAAVRIAVPSLVLLVAVLLWIVTARALAPVRKIGARAEQISLGTLSQRLPVPERDDELAELTGQLNRMLDRLEAASRRQQQFVSDASHELRSPVATILAITERNLQDSDLTRIHTEASRLSALIDTLLELARIRESASVEHEPVAVDDVLLEDADRATPAADAASVTIDTTDVYPTQVTMIRPALVGVVRNLVDNAVRHAQHEIVLRCRPVDDATVEIVVSDDGPGVPVELRDEIFDRFVRLDHGRARGLGGTGLGLALVRDLVEAYDGSVTVDDAPSGGARFTVMLPNASGHPTGQRLQAARSGSQKAESVAPRRLRGQRDNQAR